jgi:hypothetical protein
MFNVSFADADPLRTSRVRRPRLTGLQRPAYPLTDIREIGILQSFPGWREPNAV